MKYIAYIALEDDGRYTVTFPDLPGCTTGGDTLDEAHKMACEALGGHLEAMRDIGTPAPPPGTPDIPEGVIVAFVPAIVDRGTAKRVNITVDPGLLDAIDTAASDRGLTRSAFLATAARNEIEGV